MGKMKCEMETDVLKGRKESLIVIKFEMDKEDAFVGKGK